MASELKSLETDSDAESFDSMLEPPHVVDSFAGNIPGTSESQDNLAPSPDVDVPPPPRTNVGLTSEELRSPTQRSKSSPNLGTQPVTPNGAPVASTSRVQASTTRAEPSTSSTTSTTTTRPQKHKKSRSALRNAPESTEEDNSPMIGNVLEYGSKEEITRRVVFSAKMVTAHERALLFNDTWAFQKVFGYEDFFASGFVFMQPNGEKKVKNTSDNAYVFLVVEGTVAVTVHQTTYTVSQGGVLQVPRGNTYSIRSLSSTCVSKIFFVQARKVRSTEESHASLLTVANFKKPTSDTSMLLHWLIPRLIDRFFHVRKVVLVFYQRYLAKYERVLRQRGWSGGKRFYFFFFLLGLMIRRLPFVGSPPILNIQLIRYTYP